MLLLSYRYTGLLGELIFLVERMVSTDIFLSFLYCSQVHQLATANINVVLDYVGCHGLK